MGLAIQTSGIYMIKNLFNGKIYIGKSNNVSGRSSAHFKLLRSGNHSNKLLQDDFNLYKDYFVRGVVEFCKYSELSLKELFYINLFNSYINGYNNELPTIRENHKSVYNGKIKVYDGETNELLALCEGISECSRLIRVEPEKISRCLEVKGNNSFRRNRLRDYIILKEDQSIEEFLISEEDYRIRRINGELLPCYIKVDKERRNASRMSNIAKATAASAMKSRKPIGQFDLNGNLVREYKWVGEVDILSTEFKSRYVSKVIFGVQKTYKGYIWKYI